MEPLGVRQTPTLLLLLKQESLFVPFLNSFFDSIDPSRTLIELDAFGSLSGHLFKQ
jgi:hypothetical protein